MAPRQVIWNEAARREFLLSFAKRKADRKAEREARKKKQIAKARADESREVRNDMKNYIKQLKRAQMLDGSFKIDAKPDMMLPPKSRGDAKKGVVVIKDYATFYGKSSTKISIQVSPYEHP